MRVAVKFGVPAVTMLLPMQLASSIGRTASPIAAVLIACAGIAKVSPFVVVKRTCVPMAGALVTALTSTICCLCKRVADDTGRTPLSLGYRTGGVPTCPRR
ncbi:hypothetical protein [Aeromonas sp. A35_P]|uniref:hypothetical protein n=1 Tax=Aeromonas sp. A35_P TaxID=1983805 RepID=UPI003F8D245E